MGVYEEIIAQNQAFIDSTWEKLDQKLRAVAVRNREKLPHSAQNGVFDDISKEYPDGWTNGVI